MKDSETFANFENIPDGEASQISKIAELTPELQKKRLPIQNDELLRGVHPKSHGCIRARFVVNEDIDEKYRVGLFSKPGKSFRAWIRYSNASVNIAHDLESGENGSRGMAIKVMRVKGKVLNRGRGKKVQDFLMINTPEFGFASVRGYAHLTDALNASEFGDNADKLFALVIALSKIKQTPPPFPEPVQEDLDKLNAVAASGAIEIPENFSLQDLKELVTTLNIVLTKIRQLPVGNPLFIPYFGAASFRFGKDKAMKFTVVPKSSDGANVLPENPGDNYLREALTATMEKNEAITLDFRIQILDQYADFGDGKELIENTSSTWDMDGIAEIDKYESVATIEIEAPQDTTSKKALAKCEDLAFSPWNCLVDHEPIGGINRLRKDVYENSANTRGAMSDKYNKLRGRGRERGKGRV